MGLFDKVTSAITGGESNTGSNSGNQTGEADPFSIPEWAVEGMVNVEKRAEIIQTHYEEVTHQQATQIAAILKEGLETTEGWSLDDMIQDFVGVTLNERGEGYLTTSKHDCVSDSCNSGLSDYEGIE